MGQLTRNTIETREKVNKVRRKAETKGHEEHGHDAGGHVQQAEDERDHTRLQQGITSSEEGAALTPSPRPRRLRTSEGDSQQQFGTQHHVRDRDWDVHRHPKNKCTKLRR